MVKNTLLELKRKKNIHVVGVGGMESSAVAVFLADQGIKNVTLHDFSPKEEFEQNFKNARDYLGKKAASVAYQKLIKTGYQINYQSNYLKDIERADLIFVSQGWYRYDSNQKLKELEGKIAFSSITRLYFQLSPAPIIGITGTVGKSTTTSLIYKMIKDCKKSVFISGNDRSNPPILDKLLTLPKDSLLVLEVSNRQLIGLDYSAHIAVITNIFPNHPDDHASYEEYISVKSNILTNQIENDFAVLNYDVNETKSLAGLTPGEVYWFSLKTKVSRGCYLTNNTIFFRDKNAENKILNLEDIKLPGLHNVANIMAAIIVGKILGLDEKMMAKALVSFKGLRHRIELVGKINQVSFYEDSQSTAPYSTASALDSFPKDKIILIAGGYKAIFEENDYAKMVTKFFSPQVKAVLLIGKVAGDIKDLFFKLKKSCSGGPELVKNCKNLNQAAKEAWGMAAPGDIVLLSPGAESFGEFKDYRDRGEQFKKLIKKLK